MQSLNKPDKVLTFSSHSEGRSACSHLRYQRKNPDRVNYNLYLGLKLTWAWNRSPAAGGTALHSSDKQRLRTWQRGRLEPESEDTR